MDRKAEDKKVDNKKARSASHTFLLMEPRVKDRFEHRVRHVEIRSAVPRLSGLVHGFDRVSRIVFPTQSISPD